MHDIKIKVTGRQGAGKSRIASDIAALLLDNGYAVIIRDADAPRTSVPARAGFPAQPAKDRVVYIRVRQT